MKQIKAFDELKGDAYFIFKHSNICPISANAQEVVKSMENNIRIPIFKIVVQTEREVSNEVEEKTHIKHESPQLILIKNGKAIWHKSHYDINEETIEEALKKYLR